VNPAAHELLDSWSVQLPVRDPARNHAAAATALRAAGEGEVDCLVRLGMGRLDLYPDDEFGAEPDGLLVGARRKLGAADTIGKAWIVLDPRARAGLAAGRVPLAHQGSKSLRCCIDGGREAGRSGADDHHVVDLLAGPGREAGAGGQFGAPASRGQVALARDALPPAGRQLGVLLGAFELRSVGKQDERQAAGAQCLDLEQRCERIPIEVDPPMGNVVSAQEIPRGLGARGARPDDGGSDAVHPPLCVELPCQPAAQQRSCGRGAGGRWKHGGAEVVAGEQASGRVEAVHHRGCL
jgi:hypothetical protein